MAKVAFGQGGPTSLCDKYAWAIERLKEVFPDAEIVKKEMSYGEEFCVCIIIPSRKRHAFKLEYFKDTAPASSVKYMTVWDDDAQANVSVRITPHNYIKHETTPEELEQFIDRLMGVPRGTKG